MTISSPAGYILYVGCWRIKI